MTRLLNGHQANSLDRSKVLKYDAAMDSEPAQFHSDRGGCSGSGAGVTWRGRTARQYVPAANEQWRHRLPGIFTITDGYIRTADIGGPGLGIRDEMVRRPVGT